jgi:hypothetical protein
VILAVGGYLECFDRLFLYFDKKYKDAVYELISLREKIGFCDANKVASNTSVIAALRRYGIPNNLNNGCFDPMYAQDSLKEVMVKTALDFTIYAVEFYATGTNFDKAKFPF